MESASKSEGLQILLAVLLGTAALATAWAAYRGDLYSGDSLIRFNQSVQKTDQASQAYNAAQTVFVQDVNLFTQFAIAANRGEDAITAYLQTELMRPQLRKQVEWWSETGDDVGTPFVEQDPHYVAPTDDKKAQQLGAAAAEDFKAGRELDDTGDEYVLYTVLFAAALFMYGIASVATSRRVMTTCMAVGALLFVASLVMMIGTTADAPDLL